MKASFFIFVSFLSVIIGFDQNHPKTDNYPVGDMDVNVMVIPIGMEHPIKIGTMSKLGDNQFIFPNKLPKISKETEENFINGVIYSLFDVCDNVIDTVSGSVSV
jgi:hypothetical protein